MDEDRPLFWFGTTVTILVMIGTPLLWCLVLPEMNVEAGAAVISTAVGAVALLWLVLGFVQQGIELRKNTEALNAQVDELKQSVDCQRRLTELYQHMAEAQGSEPWFSIVDTGGTWRRAGNKYLPVFRFKNVGKKAAKWISLDGDSCLPQAELVTPPTKDVCSPEDTVEFSITLDQKLVDDRRKVKLVLTFKGPSSEEPTIQEFDLRHSRKGGWHPVENL